MTWTGVVVDDEAVDVVAGVLAVAVVGTVVVLGMVVVVVGVVGVVVVVVGMAVVVVAVGIVVQTVHCSSVGQQRWHGW